MSEERATPSSGQAVVPPVGADSSQPSQAARVISARLGSKARWSSETLSMLNDISVEPKLDIIEKPAIPLARPSLRPNDAPTASPLDTSPPPETSSAPNVAASDEKRTSSPGDAPIELTVERISLIPDEASDSSPPSTPAATQAAPSTSHDAGSAHTGRATKAPPPVPADAKPLDLLPIPCVDDDDEVPRPSDPGPLSTMVNEIGRAHV